MRQPLALIGKGPPSLRALLPAPPFSLAHARVVRGNSPFSGYLPMPEDDDHQPERCDDSDCDAEDRNP